MIKGMGYSRLIENRFIELGYVNSLNEFEEPTWDEGKLHWAQKGFIEGVKWQQEFNQEEINILKEELAYEKRKNHGRENR
tara:strand:+ start:149 stop:388 length:240 start_codon:yes stop_codon:yes gene_type:complete